MKKSLMAVMLVLLIVLSGCSVFSFNGNTSDKALQSMGVAYSEGEYNIENVYTYGFISNSQTVIRLVIPVSKRFLEGQTITAVSVTNAYLRTTDGKYVINMESDLTEYIDWAKSYNDGAVLSIGLKNEAKWVDSSNGAIKNNTPVVGTVNVVFKVADA